MGYSIESSGKGQKTTKKADLHVHTTFSDGTFTPQEVILKAKEKGLDTIAITDHDCVDGIEPCIEAAGPEGIEVIPGIELTCEWKQTEIHMLGYFIDYKQQWLKDKLAEICQDRIKRMRKMIESLRRFNINVDLGEVLEISGNGSLGRLHLAQALLKTRKVGSIQESFNKYIGLGKPCYVRGFRIDPFEAINIITKAGGISVLAHPHLLGKDEYISEFVKAGLKGMEVYHTDHPDNATNRYKELAESFGLLLTGGSDCHGMGKSRVLMGGVTVPYEIVEKLKQAL